MSRTKLAIAQIKRDLARINHLDDASAEQVEALAKKMHEMVEDILLHAPYAIPVNNEEIVIYEIIAYDKDVDYEISLMRTIDYAEAKAHAMKFGEQCCKDLLLNPSNGQPFDWVKLVNHDNWDIVYWASYEY